MFVPVAVGPGGAAVTIAATVVASLGVW